MNRVPLAGGATTMLAAGQPLPGAIAVDDHAIYWVNTVADGTVMRLEK